MHIAIDIRCLTEKHRTGVGEYTFQLLDALFKIDTKNQYILFYNSYTDVSNIVPKWNYEHVQYVVTRWPSKLFNLLVLCGIIKLDEWVLNNLKKNTAESTQAETPPNPPQGGRRQEQDNNFRPELSSSLVPLSHHEVSDLGVEDKSKDIAIQQYSTIDVFFSPNINFTRVSKNTKFILTIHDLSFELFKDCYSLQRRMWHRIINPRRQCTQADLILTPSLSTKLDLEKEYGAESKKVQCIYPGLGLGSRISDPQNLDSVRDTYCLSKKYMLYLGTLEPRKNISALIDAFVNSELIRHNYELVIAGARGWRYKKLLQKITSTPGVRYIGYVNACDKPALYSMASLLLFPSLYEGFGFPALEAVSYGVPVITSNRSSLPEVFGDYVYLVNPYNSLEIAQGMIRILEDTSMRDMLAQGSDIWKHFSWVDSAQELRKYCAFL